MEKIRKRLWLGDIYKAIVEGSLESVRGIEKATIDKRKIWITFSNGLYKEYVAYTEEERRKAVKAINKIISEVNKNVPQ